MNLTPAALDIAYVPHLPTTIKEVRTIDRNEPESLSMARV